MMRLVMIHQNGMEYLINKSSKLFRCMPKKNIDWVGSIDNDLDFDLEQYFYLTNAFYLPKCRYSLKKNWILMKLILSNKKKFGY